MHYTPILTLLITLLLLSGCDSNDVNSDEPEAPTYIIQVTTETFRVQINDAAVAAEAEQLLLSGEAKNINGPLVAGDGTFNAPYGWHIHPDSVTFIDATIELCDGAPSFIDDDLDYWINTVKYYCPWGIKVIGKVG